MDTFSGCRGWINGGWRGCFSAQTPPSPESCFHPAPPPPHPTIPFTPYTFTLPHTATEWLLLCPLTQTFPQKRGRKPFTPFYLLSSHPPTFLPPRWLYWLRKGYPASLSPSLPPPCFSSPQFHTATHTHGYKHTRTYKLNPPGQQLYMR